MAKHLRTGCRYLYRQSDSPLQISVHFDKRECIIVDSRAQVASPTIRKFRTVQLSSNLDSSPHTAR